MSCRNCGEPVVTTEKEGTIHENGKYACHPKVKPNDARWSLVAVEGDDIEEELTEIDWDLIPAI